MDKIDIPRIVEFFYYVTDNNIIAVSKDFKDCIVTGENIEELKENCHNAIINTCEEMYDNIASDDNSFTESQECIASDVLQGEFKVVLKLKHPCHE